MDELHLQIGKDLLLKLFGITFYRLQIHGWGHQRVSALLRLLNCGTDDIGLTPFCYQLSDKVIHSYPLVLPHHIGLHRSPARRKLIDHRYIQISVDHQRQGAGNGRSRHDQHMRRCSGDSPFFCQGGPLRHAKAVLLICDHQSQIFEIYSFREQCVGADGQLSHPKFQQLPGLTPGFGSHGAGKHHHLHTDLCKEGGKILVMLLCQNFCGGH